MEAIRKTSIITVPVLSGPPVLHPHQFGRFYALQVSLSEQLHRYNCAVLARHLQTLQQHQIEQADNGH